MTKSFFAIALCAAALCGCTKGEKYQIDGTWNDADGSVVYLFPDEKDAETPLDSAVVSNGAFCFKGTVDAMTPAKLVAGSQHEYVLLYDYEEPLRMSIESEVKPSNRNADSLVTINHINFDNLSFDQKVFRDGKEQETSWSLVSLIKMIALSKYASGEMDIPEDSLEVLIQTFDKGNIDGVNNYLDSAKTSRASVFFIKDHVLRNFPFAMADSSYSVLSDDVKASKEGQQLRSDLDKAGQCVIGGIPDDFTLKTPSGEDFNLYALRGKYVILDFWASWCGPCRAEMPNVKSIYADYHDRGLEILGVSLDDDAAKWTGAIENLDLPWHHVSALVGWDCPVAKQFNVTGIPRMFILDPDGKIIDMDLRGEALRTRISGLFAE